MSKNHVLDVDFDDQCQDATYFYPLRKNRLARFDFRAGFVLVACRGDQVSFNTTVGGGVVL